MKRNILLLTIILPILFSTGCKDFLNEKSNIKLVIPKTAADNQALLDVGFSNIEFSSDGETSSDDFYLTDADYNAKVFEEDKRLYTWRPDHVAKKASLGNAWSRCYRAIYYSNAVLYNLEDKKLTGPEADNVKGQALALRAARYLDAVQIWCKAYRVETAEAELGLPLRLDPDMNPPSVRSTLKQTYAQIINDLNAAVSLLPVKQVSAWRIGRPAAYGLLARAYLFMSDYTKSLDNALLALQLVPNTLMDFNAIDDTKSYPIAMMNSEVLFWAGMSYQAHLVSAKIPLHIYQSYDGNDLRKKVFFNINSVGEIIFKAHYNNANGPNASITVDELYLIAAECYARKENTPNDAMNMLNQLLIKRWKIGTFVPLSANSKEQALQIVLQERRKELLIRGLRWADLKRFNRDGANIALTRTVNGKTYSLPPNDPRYAIAIPEEIIALTGMPQNGR